MTGVAVRIDGSELAPISRTTRSRSPTARWERQLATTMELVATMSDGSSRTQAFPISSLDAP